MPATNSLPRTLCSAVLAGVLVVRNKGSPCSGTSPRPRTLANRAEPRFSASQMLGWTTRERAWYSASRSRHQRDRPVGTRIRLATRKEGLRKWSRSALPPGSRIPYPATIRRRPDAANLKGSGRVKPMPRNRQPWRQGSSRDESRIDNSSIASEKDSIHESDWGGGLLRGQHRRSFFTCFPASSLGDVLFRSAGAGGFEVFLTTNCFSDSEWISLHHKELSMPRAFVRRVKNLVGLLYVNPEFHLCACLAKFL